jgi:16S rRNA (cytidine1402-2'-O)-methyltransferase
VLAALALAGLPSDRFLFAGFVPSGGAARRRWLTELAAVPATLVCFQTATRVRESLGDMCEIWGRARMAALCREMTKRFEEVRRGTLDELAQSVAADPPRGELVLVVDRAAPPRADAAAIEAALRDALARAPVRQAADEVAAAFGQSRRDMYQAALKLRAADGDDAPPRR